MRNFHAWQRRTMRRADRQFWGGLLLILATSVGVAWIANLLERAGPLAAAVSSILRYLAAPVLVAGAVSLAIGAWTLWRLHRDPILLYYRRDGR